MRSSPAIAMPVSFKITFKITTVAVAIGLQIVAFWLAGSVNILVNFFTLNFSANYSIAPPAVEQVSQIYQPPIFIGSPSSTMGSGTR